MQTNCVIVGPFEVNCYILHNSAKQALVIDAGADAAKIARALDAGNLRVLAYLATHGHIDHISALAELTARHPAPIAMQSADLSWAFTPSNQLPPYYSAPEQPHVTFRELSDGQQLQDGNFAYQVIGTPGHSPGGVCLFFPAGQILFSGDTLFQGTVGRTDLPGGDSRTLTRSLRRLTTLPPQTTVYPGHGTSTTIGDELRNNPFMQPPP